MTRGVKLRTAAGILAMVTALSAQTGRDAYRDAFKAWRQGDPNLERDAATSTDLSQRTGAAGAAAAQYSTKRAAYLRAAVVQANQSAQWLTNAQLNPEPDLAPAVEMQKLVADSTQRVSDQIARYANESEPALESVRQALARERAALVALSGAITARQAAVSKAAGALVAVEQARAKTLEPYQAVAGALQGAAGGMEQEALAWAEYYRMLAEDTHAAIVAALPPTPPASNLTNPAGGTAEARINNPAPLAGAPTTAASPTPVSWARYTGSWTFPTVGGLYHGPEPDVVNLEVKEEAGKLSGTMDARFWPYGDVTNVSKLHFDFSGTPVVGKTLSFPLRTSDGVKGTIDLIPGPAFNLLEINYFTDHVPGKLSLGNLLLVKK